MARTQLVALTAAEGMREGRRLAEQTREQTEAAIKADADNRADFASSGLPPDWLTTGIAGAGAGWLFGPVGGLVGAAIAAITSKRRKDGIAMQANADAKTAASLIDGGDRSLKRLEATAKTDEEKLEVALLRDRYDAAVTLANNPDSQVALEGFRELLGLPGLLEAEADEIESERLDAEARERDQLQRYQEQTLELRNRNQVESRPFLEQSAAFRQFERLVADGLSNADRTLASNLMARIVNPGEIITEGDVSVITSGGGIDSAVANRFNEWVLGRSQLDDQTAIEMFEAAKDLVRIGYEDQVNRNKDFIELGTEVGLPQRFLDNIAIRNPLDPATFEKRKLEPAPGDDSANAPRSTRSEAAQDLRNVSEGVFEYLGIEPGADVVEHNGLEYVLRDHGEGRREWVPVPSLLDQARRRNEERMLESPGLFQPGGLFGPEMTEDQRRRKRELEQRRRAVNE